MKPLVYIALLILYSCTNNDSNISDSIPVTSDTFVILNESICKSSDEFYFDTLRIKGTKNEISGFFVLPKSNAIDSAVINTTLLMEFNLIRDSFMRALSPKKEGDEKELQACWPSVDIKPVHLYRNSNKLSASFVAFYSDTCLVRPYTEYFTINYDLRKKKKILFHEVFELRNKKDSILVYSLHFRSLHDKSEPIIYHDEFKPKFTLDDSCIYFYNSQYEYGISNARNGGIRKKFIDKSIKHDFQ